MVSSKKPKVTPDDPSAVFKDIAKLVELGLVNVIVEANAALDGAPILTGRTPREKGVIHMMSKRAELELLDAISVYFHRPRHPFEIVVTAAIFD